MAGGGYRGTQGRKPKASTMVERERKKGESPNEAPSRVRLPAAPRSLSKGAKKEWRRLVKQLMEVGLWKDIYTDSLAMYCTALEQYSQALEMLNGPMGHCPSCDPRKPDPGKECRGRIHVNAPYGLIIKNRMGEWVKSPYVSQKKEAESLMVRLNSEFGMTLASNSRMPGARGEPASPRPRAMPATGPHNDPRKLYEAQVLAGMN